CSSRTDSSGPFWPSSRCAGGNYIATWTPCLTRDGKVLAGRSLTPCGIDRYDAGSTLPRPFFWWQSGKEVLPPSQPQSTRANLGQPLPGTPVPPLCEWNEFSKRRKMSQNRLTAGG